MSRRRGTRPAFWAAKGPETSTVSGGPKVTWPLKGAEFRDDGRVVLFGGFLAAAIAIHAHYQVRGEVLRSIVGERFGTGDRYEAAVSCSSLLFNVKVTVNEDGVVHEYGREEI